MSSLGEIMLDAAKLTPFFRGRRRMAEIMCDGCGHRRQVDMQPTNVTTPGIKNRVQPGDIIRGMFVCHACKTKSAFEMDEKAISYKPSGELPSLSLSTPPAVVEKYEEAGLCVYLGAYRAGVVMARAAVEEALTQKGVKERDLKASINKAKAAGLLSDDIYTFAHGSRLVGNDAIHDVPGVSSAMAFAVVNAAAEVITHIWP